MNILSKLDFSDIPAVASLAGLGGLAVATFVGALYQRIKEGKLTSPSSSSEPEALRGDPMGTKLMIAVRFFTCPVVAVSGIWSLGQHPTAFTSVIPALFRNYTQTALRTIMPVHPTNFHEAFQLGHISNSVEQLLASGVTESANSVQELLKKAAEIAGRHVSLDDLLAVPNELLLMSQQRSLTDRILGAFTLVNFVWVVSTIGLGVTALPFLYQILPSRDIPEKVWEKIISPILEALIPFYEHIAYIVSFYLMVESARYPLTDEYQMTGTIVALSGLIGFGLSWLYTSMNISAVSNSSWDVWPSITSMLMLGASAPLAVLHQSKLLGYISVASFVCGLGFSIFSTRFSISLGWDGDDVMARGTASCCILALINASARALQMDTDAWIQPFSSAINCFATTVYFIGLNTLTAMDSSNCNYYLITNVVNIIAFGVMGTVLNLDGMANSAKAWSGVLGLVMMVKYRPDGGVVIPWLFGLFATLFGASFYVSRNPAVMAAIFSGF